jgi:hypothetical protein
MARRRDEIFPLFSRLLNSIDVTEKISSFETIKLFTDCATDGLNQFGNWPSFLFSQLEISISFLPLPKLKRGTCLGRRSP